MTLLRFLFKQAEADPTWECLSGLGMSKFDSLNSWGCGRPCLSQKVGVICRDPESFWTPKAAPGGGACSHLGGQVFCLNGRLLRRKDGRDITALCWAGFSCPRRQALLANCAPTRGLTCPLASSGPAAGAMYSQRESSPPLVGRLHLCPLVL